MSLKTYTSIKRFALCFVIAFFFHTQSAEASIIVQQLGNDSSFRAPGDDFLVSIGTGVNQLGSLTVTLNHSTTGNVAAIVFVDNFNYSSVNVNFPSGTTTGTFDFTALGITATSGQKILIDLLPSSGTIDVVGSYSGTYPAYCYDLSILCSPLFYPYFIADTTSAPTGDTSTRFVSLEPNSGSTVSTTTNTTTGAHVYINSTDYESGVYLEYYFGNQTVAYVGGSALDAFTSAGFGVKTKIPINASNTIVTLATSTHFIYPGVTKAYYRVVTPNFASSLWLIGGFFTGDTLISTTTSFIVGASTTIDEAIANNTLGDYLLTGTTSPNAKILKCNPVGFDIMPCLTSLIIPPSEILTQDMDRMKNDILVKVPWGYATRLFAILSASSTNALPTVSIDLSHLPINVSGPWTINMQDTFEQGDAVMNSFHDPASGLGVKDILKPILQLFVALFAIFIIWKDLTSMKPH